MKKGRPKLEPTSIFPVRYNAAAIKRMRKKHGRKIHDHLKNELKKIDETGWKLTIPLYLL